jgi:L-ascorbate metabolism protein UlaG (beta-lactamase superfamily)
MPAAGRFLVHQISRYVCYNEFGGKFLKKVFLSLVINEGALSMKLTWFANATLLIEAGGERLLFDPFVPLKGAENMVTAEDYERDNKIFITHGHLDHAESVGLIASNGDSHIFCTATPAGHLMDELQDKSKLTVIKPGDRFEWSDVSVTVHPGQHIEYDGRLVWRTLFSFRNLRYMKNAAHLIRGRRKYRENKETVIYEVCAGGRTVVVLGSLALLEGHEYPQKPDMLVLPYQGNSDLLTPALHVIGIIKPRAVLLDHFDDAFPPLTRTIDTRSFEEAAGRQYPDMRVIKPTPQQCIDV